MTQTGLVLVTVAAVALLLFLVLKLRIQAFISLLITSMFVGIATGMPLGEVIKSIQNGMGGTLGFVATVVGLGAIFGQILEASGGAESLAKSLVNKFGKDKASWALVLTGFIVAIPVFFDVGFIILVPIVYALSKDTKKSVLFYGIPLLAGLAVTHSFIPPTPGPVAVAEIIGADLGWVILFGFIVGLPTAIVAGPVFGKYISEKINIKVPTYMIQEIDNDKKEDNDFPSFSLVTSIIGVPLVLILLNTLTGVLVKQGSIQEGFITNILGFLGHPFVALSIATLLALYLLGTKRGFTKQQLLDLSTKALAPAGLIILVTGAGGVFKQILIDSGVGKMLANTISNSNLPPIILAYILAVVVRITQGSATVSMITSAGIIAPVMDAFALGAPDRALIVLSIAAGATILSHVNDSGFWLVGRYFGMTEQQTLKSWTIMETIISLVGFAVALILSFLV
ncbi:GntP family permease [Caldisalinibacter kiritimatiensis]|uniref:Low-affinity gluconate/H+ symporter GntU n=1 Tax=Caldisalinibacter kiritimatiensis TaxID=1304284 RepID=R1AYN4_9FIRM|nr:gluconate:H+ symporter [Caldisalinibacter kiritimatiensis]EOD01817.1 Low-affinity gluconate/H+ symporter GntU [Caldisalinibacter kiritimatiensis]